MNNEIECPPSPESIIEAIRFVRRPGTCENGDQHDFYGIESPQKSNWIHYCPHPFCDITGFQLPSAPPYVLLTQWINTTHESGRFGEPLATAYLLLIRPLDALPRVEARISIASQWPEGLPGRFGQPVGDRLRQRYFAESGPGVYPATIERLQPHEQ